MKGLVDAIGFLTIVPVGSRSSSDSKDLSTAKSWFGVVGLLLGAALALADLLLSVGFGLSGDDGGQSPLNAALPLTATLLVGLLVVLTRALHLDGFMDCCDGLFGSSDRKRRLEIMRDPRVGAFAVVGVVVLLMLKVTAIIALPQSSRVWVLLVFPCVSRCSMFLAMESFNYVRPWGTGTAFVRPASMRQRLAVGLVVLTVSVLFGGLGGIVLLAVGCSVALVIGQCAKRLLGGLTGDVYGAINEIAEVLVLVVAAVLSLSTLSFAVDYLSVEPIMTLW